MDFENLTPEQKEAAKNCKTPEEVLELSRKMGYELSLDELEAVNGGLGSWGCPGDGTCDEFGCPTFIPCAVGSTRPSKVGSKVGYV